MFGKCLQYNGTVKNIYSLVENGKDRFIEYYEHITEHRPIEQGAMKAQLEYMKDNGPHPLPTRFRNLHNTLYEIKTNKSRAICFFENDDISSKNVYLVLGFDKGTDKAQQNDITRALKIKKRFETFVEESKLK